jgi:hypothetical protein
MLEKMKPDQTADLLEEQARRPTRRRRRGKPADLLASTTAPSLKEQTAIISPPNFQRAKILLVGKTPLVMNKMSGRVKNNMIKDMEAGSRKNKGTKREPKNFDAVYKGAMHLAEDGWYGIPASALRTALVDACRLVGFKMTIAKLSVFVEADGLDNEDGQPLVRLTKGTPKRRDLAVKLANGSTDILPRPFFFPWEAKPTLVWDGDQFSTQDVLNLLARVGQQVGVGAGRPNSKNSTGMGWGTFGVEEI